MKLVIINKSGNVGKSELSRHAFPGNKILSVEMLNANDHNVEGLRGTSDEIMLEAMLEDNLTIDVGASEYERFIKMIKSNPGTESDIDRWLIPVTPSHKQQADSLDTIGDLLSLGINQDHIRVVFNKVEQETFCTEFSGIMNSLKELGIKYNEQAIIPETDVFLKLSMAEKTMQQIEGDKTDYKVAIMEAEPKDKRTYAIRFALQRAVTGLSTHIKQVQYYVSK